MGRQARLRGIAGPYCILAETRKDRFQSVQESQWKDDATINKSTETSTNRKEDKPAMMMMMMMMRTCTVRENDPAHLHAHVDI